MKRRVLLVFVLVAATGLSAAAMYARRGDSAPVVQTDVVSRGSIVGVVSATGTLEAVETVQVGTQVSGTVQMLYADFNSIVRKGQTIARLDPSLIQAEIARARANVAGADAEVERLRVLLNDAETKLKRAQELSARQLIPRSDLDAAETTRRTNEAQIKAAMAQATQSRAALSQSEVNLRKTVITSPIDGIVISRAVDVGQTVAASLQAPTIFTIAADLGRMQLKASIDESDLGSIKEGQPVSFRVDAYPTDVFNGVVRQVRLNPVIESNVVTYAAIITAPNPELKLKPGMTASVTVETARRDNVLRVPSAAVRFKPTSAVLAAFGESNGASGQTAVRTAVGTSGDGSARVVSSGSPPQNLMTLWLYDGERLRSTPVSIGAGDGTFTEIVDGNVKEGDTVAMQVTLPGATTSARPASSTSNPLMGQAPRRF